jgi:hypothetical protein
MGGAALLRQVDIMPIQYQLDDTKRRIRLTLTDPVTVADFLASVERQLADGTWSYGTLIDARIPFTAPRASDMRKFVASVLELIQTHGPRGPVAVVTRESGAISSSQMYNVFGGKTESIEVFWDLDDAQQWLDKKLAGGSRDPRV